jgi:hypothetical protein
MLVVIAVVIYGIKLAFAGDWKGLIWLVVILIASIWILGALGIQLPNIPSLR